MTAITTSANAIININKALHAILKTYLDPEASSVIDIRFDLPNVDTNQSIPTISVFLYDVHEDLQMRQSEPARLNAGNSSLRAGWVNLNCNYLITYWETSTGNDGNGPDSAPDNPAVQVMTKTLQALLNNRELSGIAGAYARIIPPQENLNSLGNFWQSLGNRPRLSLMYSVTVPILLENKLPQTLVKTVTSEIAPAANVDLPALNRLLRRTLSQQMGSGAEQALARVTLVLEPQSTAEKSAQAITVKLIVSGLVDKSDKENLETILTKWEKDEAAVTEINSVKVYISAVNYSDVIIPGEDAKR